MHVFNASKKRFKVKELTSLEEEFQLLFNIQEIEKFAALTIQISRNAKSENTLKGYANLTKT